MEAKKMLTTITDPAFSALETLTITQVREKVLRLEREHDRTRRFLKKTFPDKANDPLLQDDESPIDDNSVYRRDSGGDCH